MKSSREAARKAHSARRLDVALVERQLVTSRERAQALIMAGAVRVDGETERRASRSIHPERVLTIDAPPRFVSRGGLKLEHALSTFAVDVQDRICLDAGASTGGFVDCLLQRGAARVYAVDVGYGQLDWRLREDARVIVMERTNVRHLESLPESVECVTADVSFISLRLVLPTLRRLCIPDAPIVTLIKPQFEAGREDVRRGGVVRDVLVHERVIHELSSWGAEAGETLVQLTSSPLRGPAGNIEFLGLWSQGVANAVEHEEVSRVVREAHERSTA